MVHCLCTLRHYLLGAHFTVYTDNITTRYIQTQKKLSPKQARWKDFLPEFDFELVYKIGQSNVVAYTLSRKVEFVAITIIHTDPVEAIKEGLETDPVARSLIKLAEEGLPRSVVSDNDSRFTSKLWTKLFKIIGTDLHFSAAFHTYNNERTERIISLMLPLTLCECQPAGLGDVIDIAQFLYNLQQSEST
ncbi:LOW QUALITY PROTEIN: hypothetical protein V2J09_004805 [Rumex salicifolius]